MRSFLARFPRIALYASGGVAWIIALVMLSVTGCASVPASRDHPQVACRFDELHRFNYALIVERDSFVTTWVMRRIMSASKDSFDTEERTDPSSIIRMGWCPDESQQMIGHRDVWRQEDPE